MKKTPLLILFFTVFLDLIGFGLVIPVLPIYADDLGAAALTIGLIEASFSGAQFFFAPFWGALSDRLGRRPALLMSISVMLLSYLVLANASTFNPPLCRAGHGWDWCCQCEYCQCLRK
ncbi:MAG: MFS transporter [Owenweeksia sp.]|nr:MFS transporter [Owenweeksia sp.]